MRDGDEEALARLMDRHPEAVRQHVTAIARAAARGEVDPLADAYARLFVAAAPPS